MPSFPVTFWAEKRMSCLVKGLQHPEARSAPASTKPSSQRRCGMRFKRSWAHCPVKEVRAELLLDRAIAATNANATEAAKPLVGRRAAVEEWLQRSAARRPT